MNVIKEYYSELESAINFILDDEDYYKYIKDAIDDYIENGTETFIYKWYDDFFEKDCEIKFDIGKLLSEASRLSVFPLRDFLIKENNNYDGLINSLYLSVLECCSNELFSTEKEKSINEQSCVFFISLSYFSSLEQSLVLNGLIKSIKGKGDLINEDAYETLIPLVFYLSKNYMKVGSETLRDDIEWGLNKFKFNSMYESIVNGLLRNEDVSSLMREICDYHIFRSYSDDEVNADFENVIYKLIPFEIIVLLRIRSLNGLSNENINHPLLNRFKLFINNNVPLNNFNISLKTSIFRKKNL